MQTDIKPNKPYWAKLQDPRWQEKRKEVLERYKHVCSDCGKRNAPLDVHHQYYCSKREPWEYPDWNFVALCRDCHDKITYCKSNFFEQAMQFFGSEADFMVFLLSVQFKEIPESKRYLAFFDLIAYVSEQIKKGEYNAD